MKNWGETFHIEFFIDFHEMDFSGWVNIMHFTTGLTNIFNTPHLYNLLSLGENTGDGARLPSIWANNKKLHIYTEYNGDNNFAISSDNEIKDHWERIVVSQQWVDGKLMLKFLHDGDVVFNGENKSGKNRENVQVYLSDPWYTSIVDHAWMYHLKISDRAPPSGNIPYSKLRYFI